MNFSNPFFLRRLGNFLLLAFEGLNVERKVVGEASPLLSACFFVFSTCEFHLFVVCSVRQITKDTIVV